MSNTGVTTNSDTISSAETASHAVVLFLEDRPVTKDVVSIENIFNHEVALPALGTECVVSWLPKNPKKG